MDKKTVEANDQKFREKLKELRANLANRRRSVNKNSRSGFAVKALVLVLLFSAGAYVFKGGSMKGSRSGEPDPAPETSASGERLVESRESKNHDKIFVKKQDVTGNTISQEISSKFSAHKNGVETAPSLEPKSSIDSESSLEMPPLVGPIADRHQTAAPPGGDLPSKNSDFFHQSLPMNPQKRRTQSGPTVGAVQEKLSGPAELPVKSSVKRRSRITRKFTCASVKGRECDFPRTVFPFSEKPTPTPHFWMEVYSESLPYVLKHVYYHDGRKYCEVPLEIKYPRMRTWSNITLADSSFIGQWRVEIVDETGSVLGETRFEVAPGDGSN